MSTALNTIKAMDHSMKKAKCTSPTFDYHLSTMWKQGRTSIIEQLSSCNPCEEIHQNTSRISCCLSLPTHISMPPSAQSNQYVERSTLEVNDPARSLVGLLISEVIQSSLTGGQTAAASHSLCQLALCDLQVHLSKEGTPFLVATRLMGQCGKAPCLGTVGLLSQS